MNGERQRLLIVDDEPEFVKAIGVRLEAEGYEVVPAYNGPDALEKISREEVSLALLDIVMPGMDGIEVLKRLKKIDPWLPVVMITAHSSYETTVSALRNGAVDYIEKPLSTEKLKKTIQQGLRKAKLSAAKSQLKGHRDITERKKRMKKEKKGRAELEKTYVKRQDSKDALAHSEKLAFTGRIAASIAHEIRNPLTNVTMAVQQVKRAIKSEHPMAKHVDIINRNTERINLLITELLNCARPPKLDIQPYDIHKILQNILESNKTKIEAQKIEVVKRFTSKPSLINLDKEQMERAFLNLVINAIEAIPKKRGGKLTIATGYEGDFLVVKIQDTGKGIPEEDIMKVFDPFFSSKSSGVGLGLTICYGIIASHGGIIEVESMLRKGAIFTISLPLSPTLGESRVIKR